ncbi:MAG: PBECR4 domain-containing protein [Treponema sp.]|nr:PBECR4 domain-containing protein [Treponema sp.]
MNNIYDTAISFSKLLNIEYEIILGRKNTTVCLIISFEKRHFYHLAGLQYIEDLRELSLMNIQSDKVFHNIISQKLSAQKIESSQNYSRIQDRVDFLYSLENIFDSNETIFKYDPKKNILTSKIQGEYLMKNNFQNTDLFVFLDKSDNGKYYCRSFFPQSFSDYSKDQTRWTVLSKKKRWKNQDIEIILFDYNAEKKKKLDQKNEIESKAQQKFEDFCKSLENKSVILPRDKYNELMKNYKIVHQHCNITISGKEYECVKGLAKGFADLVGENQELKKELQTFINKNKGFDYTD